MVIVFAGGPGKEVEEETILLIYQPGYSPESALAEIKEAIHDYICRKAISN